MAGIDINQLAAQINSELRRYVNVVEEDVQKIADDVSKEGVKLLRARSPKEPNGGQYAKSWKRKKIDGKWVLYNSDYGNMASWLEKGHALRDGGRTDPQPHIAPVEAELVQEFERKVEDAISGN